MIYFIADTHFGHENVIKFCNRPFSCADEMDEVLIENWNSRVRWNDSIFILGDMFFRATEIESILKRLKGKKHLIVGNHDKYWMKKVNLSDYFESVDRLLETSDGQHGLTLCHYPLLSWNHQERTYMVHGHIHADTTMDFWPLIAKRDRVLNAGVDVNNFMPVTFDELVENNKNFKVGSLVGDKGN